MVGCLVLSVLGLFAIMFLANNDNFLGKYENFSNDELNGVRAFLITATALVSAMSLAAWHGVMTFNTRIVRPFLYLCAGSLFAKVVIWIAILAKKQAVCDRAYTRLCTDVPDGAVPLESCATQSAASWKSGCASNVQWATLASAVLQCILGWWLIHALWSYCRLVELGVLTEDDPNGVWWGLSEDMRKGNHHVQDEHFYDDNKD